MKKIPSFFRGLLYIIWSIAFIFLVISINLYENEWRAWFNMPSMLKRTSDPDSRLLSVLITKESFPDDYSWSAIDIVQGARNPSSDNGYSLEHASVDFYGYAGSDKVRVVETVIRHVRPLINLGEVRFPSTARFFRPDTVRVILPVSLVTVGFLQESKCGILLDGSTNCTVLMAYSDLSVELGLAINHAASENDIKSILNPLLEDIGRRLSEY